MKNSSKGIIGAIIGCCVILFIIIAIGGYFAYKSISDQAKKIQQQIEQDQKIVETNNQGVALRDNIIEKIEVLTSELTTNPDKTNVENAISDLDKEIDIFAEFIKDKSPSEELNSLHENYLEDTQNVSTIAHSLIENYNDITKYNTLIEDYNDGVDKLNKDNQDIADYISTITTLETNLENNSSFDFEKELENAFDF